MMKNKNERTYSMMTRVVSDMVTNHFRKLGMLDNNEKFTVKYVEGDNDVTVTHGEIERDQNVSSN